MTRERKVHIISDTQNTITKSLEKSSDKKYLQSDGWLVLAKICLYSFWLLTKRWNFTNVRSVSSTVPGPLSGQPANLHEISWPTNFLRVELPAGRPVLWIICPATLPTSRFPFPILIKTHRTIWSPPLSLQLESKFTRFLTTQNRHREGDIQDMTLASYYQLN